VFRNYKVGALTSKPYAFIARPWELQVIESFDVFDLGQTKLRVEIRTNQILRILPRIDYNYYFTEWVTNKTRFSYDAQNLLRESYISALGLQNLIVSLVVSWKSVFQTIKHFLFFYQFSIIVGEQLGLRTLFEGNGFKVG
jgi:NADH-quinone oxidoreductase subunit G